MKAAILPVRVDKDRPKPRLVEFYLTDLQYKLAKELMSKEINVSEFTAEERKALKVLKELNIVNSYKGAYFAVRPVK